MTREYILQNLEGACPIWFIDNPQLRDEVMSTLQDSLLIPKPKFKVGDRVRFGSYIFEIENRFYDIDANEYQYGCLNYEWNIFPESELELVEAAE